MPNSPCFIPTLRGDTGNRSVALRVRAAVDHHGSGKVDVSSYGYAASLLLTAAPGPSKCRRRRSIRATRLPLGRAHGGIGGCEPRVTDLAHGVGDRTPLTGQAERGSIEVGERYRWNPRDNGQCATGQGGQGGELNQHRQDV